MSEKDDLNIAANILYSKPYDECNEGEKSRARQLSREAKAQADKWTSSWSDWDFPCERRRR